MLPVEGAGPVDGGFVVAGASDAVPGTTSDDSEPTGPADVGFAVPAPEVGETWLEGVVPEATSASAEHAPRKTAATTAVMAPVAERRRLLLPVVIAALP